MATQKEKQLAITILKERIEYQTGKKVILQENVNPTSLKRESVKISLALKEAIVKEFGEEGLRIFQENIFGTSDLDKSLLWFNKVRKNQPLYSEMKTKAPNKAKAFMNGLVLWKKWYDQTGKEKKIGFKSDPNDATKQIAMTLQELKIQKKEKQTDMQQFTKLINPLRQTWNKNVGLIGGGL